MKTLINALKLTLMASVAANIVACSPSVEVSPIDIPSPKPGSEYDLILNAKGSSTIEYNSMIINTDQNSWSQKFQTVAHDSKEVEFGGWALSGDGCYAPQTEVHVYWKEYEGDALLYTAILGGYPQYLNMVKGRKYKIEVNVEKNTRCDFGILTFAVYE
ncbi:MAG: hypothetical protein KDD50_15230 [Bdellovibrionales bacterium]|nr:hypothetical protein [Bdellovibrionales bacterium]